VETTDIPDTYTSYTHFKRTISASSTLQFCFFLNSQKTDTKNNVKNSNLPERDPETTYLSQTQRLRIASKRCGEVRVFKFLIFCEGLHSKIETKEFEVTQPEIYES
jgi:hypothetical protein